MCRYLVLLTCLLMVGCVTAPPKKPASSSQAPGTTQSQAQTSSEARAQAGQQTQSQAPAQQQARAQPAQQGPAAAVMQTQPQGKTKAQGKIASTAKPRARPPVLARAKSAVGSLAEKVRKSGAARLGQNLGTMISNAFHRIFGSRPAAPVKAAPKRTAAREPGGEQNLQPTEVAAITLIVFIVAATVLWVIAARRPSRRGR